VWASFAWWVGEALLLFAMNSMLGFDKLALKYTLTIELVVRSSFVVLLVTARSAKAAGQPFIFGWLLQNKRRLRLGFGFYLDAYNSLSSWGKF
jgi:hypothetical protein